MPAQSLAAAAPMSPGAPGLSGWSSGAVPLAPACSAIMALGRSPGGAPAHSLSGFAKHPREDHVDGLEVVVEVEHGGEFGFRQKL